MGDWELYRQIAPGTSTISLACETLHVIDDTNRVAIIDTPTIDTLSTGEVQTLRYQLSNHIGSASLELDEVADIISYEEYYPFGNTSYQCGRNAAECSLKRYRYVGKERDDESGFYYIGARYYCPWLARWLAVDPINNDWYNLCKGQPQRNAERQFVEQTASSYEYCYANPVRFTDPSGEQPPVNENKFTPQSWKDDAGHKYSINEKGEGTIDPVTVTGQKIQPKSTNTSSTNGIEYQNLGLVPITTGKPNPPGHAGKLTELSINALALTARTGTIENPYVALGVIALYGIAVAIDSWEQANEDVDAKPLALPIDFPLSDTKKDELNYYIHYTNKEGLEGILSTRAIFPNKKGIVYLTKVFMSPDRVERDIFLSNPLYKGKGDFMVVFSVTPDQEVDIIHDEINMYEYLYRGGGSLRLKGELYYAGPNLKTNRD